MSEGGSVARERVSVQREEEEKNKLVEEKNKLAPEMNFKSEGKIIFNPKKLKI